MLGETLESGTVQELVTFGDLSLVESLILFELLLQELLLGLVVHLSFGVLPICEGFSLVLVFLVFLSIHHYVPYLAN